MVSVRGPRVGGRAVGWVLLTLIVVCLFLPVPSGLGKDIELTGTIDCGGASGATCSIGSTVSIWTTDVDGTRKLVTVDVQWIVSQLPVLHQDDLITFEVEDLGDGHFQVVAVHGIDGVSGTNVPGASTGSHLAS